MLENVGCHHRIEGAARKLEFVYVRVDQIDIADPEAADEIAGLGRVPVDQGPAVEPGGAGRREDAAAAAAVAAPAGSRAQRAGERRVGEEGGSKGRVGGA